MAKMQMIKCAANCNCAEHRGKCLLRLDGECCLDGRIAAEVRDELINLL